MVAQELKHMSGVHGLGSAACFFFLRRCGFFSVAAKSVDTLYSAPMSCTQHLSRSCDEYCNLIQIRRSSASEIGQRRLRTSADLSGGAPNAAPATQNESELLQVLHLPRKSSRRP